MPKKKWLDIVVVNKGNHGGGDRRKDI